MAGCAPKSSGNQDSDSSTQLNSSAGNSNALGDVNSEKIKPYGQLVDVRGKKMNVYIVGEGEETIVWIPGYADIAPGISYTKMLEELSPKYRVVVVEPFGYGLSDITDDERTIENITEEIHEALQAIDVKKYILIQA